MVIVKLASKNAREEDTKKFTFQYGYSKTWGKSNARILVTVFTFQYGYSKTFCLYC